MTPQNVPPSLPALFHGTEDMKTFSAKANEVKRQWWVIDAADQVLGRVAVKAANLLRGKDNSTVNQFYTKCVCVLHLSYETVFTVLTSTNQLAK